MGADKDWMNARVVAVLDAISQPAAPFYEERVNVQIRKLLAPLEAKGVVVREDRYGNLMALYLKSDKPVFRGVAMASHMDHPGFDVLEQDGLRLRAAIAGGLARDERMLGTRVRFFAGEDEVLGTVTAFADSENSTVWVDLEAELALMEPVFGVCDVDRFRREEPLLHGRAMDDLAGCAIQIAALEQIVAEALPVDVLMMFHRAEEVGFIGALGSCELQSIPMQYVVISLEASKVLDGAQPGAGVVIRTGDRMNLFDANVLAMLNAAAEKAGEKGWQFQQRRMDGGSCEASAYYACGYETAGIAVPLINYHNQGEGKIEAEAIHGYDLSSGVALMVELTRLAPEWKQVPRVDQQRQMFNHFCRYQRRLLGEPVKRGDQIGK